MLKSVPVEEAVGMVLPHDITEIVKDVKKGVAFKKGHIIRQEDVVHLQRLGKDNIFVLSLGSDEVHENEAASILARCLAGQGVEYADNPQEGKITITAAIDGLLRVNKHSLYQFNMLGEVMCASLHDNTPVTKDEIVAATRLIPLVGSRTLLTEAEKIARSSAPIIEVAAPAQA